MAITSTMHASAAASTAPSRNLVSPLLLLKRLAVSIAEWQRRAAERRALCAMSLEERKDIGFSRCAEEMHKPGWKP
jgi:uncharacterized protein YjiS (DUF1127 family)